LKIVAGFGVWPDKTQQGARWASFARLSTTSAVSPWPLGWTGPGEYAGDFQPVERCVAVFALFDIESICAAIPMRRQPAELAGQP
jgi:hypothetical protein